MSRPGSPSRGRVAALVMAAALALTPLLSACGSTQAGAAAVVGDRRITVDEVQTATAELKTIVQDPNQITQGIVLGWLIANSAVVQVANERGQGVSRADALRFFDPAHFRNASAGSTPSSAAVTAAQTVYAMELMTPQNNPQAAKEAADQVIAALKADKITVNPRYGSFDYAWDPQTQSFTLSPRKVNWLSTPTPTASQPAPASS